MPRYTPLRPRDELELTPGLGAGRKPDPYPYSNVIYLAAASDSEPAMDIGASALVLYPTLDGKPHGAVTDVLLRVLKGELPADFDRNGSLDYAEMSRAVQDFVAARGYGHTPRVLPGIAEDRYRLASRALFGGAPAPAGTLARPIPVDETLRVRLEGASDALAERLRTERGVSVVTGASDVMLRTETAGLHLLSPAYDEIGFAGSEEGAIGHIRQLAWAKRLRAIGERGRRGLLEIEANPAEAGGTFIEGPAINFVVRPDRDVVLLLFNVDAEGNVTVLYPNNATETHHIAGGAQTFIPGTGPYERIKVEEPFGTDLLFAFGFDAMRSWLPEVMTIEKAPPGAGSLIALERRLREHAGGYAFATLEQRAVRRQALP